MTNAEARFSKSHIRKVYACLAVTCHLHFWQNGRDFLRATVVTRGWNGYRNKSQHRKSTWAPVPNKPTVSVNVKQHSTTYVALNVVQELCESRDGRPENSPAVPAGIRTRDLSGESGALTTELSPPPLGQHIYTTIYIYRDSRTPN